VAQVLDVPVDYFFERFNERSPAHDVQAFLEFGRLLNVVAHDHPEIVRAVLQAIAAEATPAHDPAPAARDGSPGAAAGVERRGPASPGRLRAGMGRIPAAGRVWQQQAGRNSNMATNIEIQRIGRQQASFNVSGRLETLTQLALLVGDLAALVVSAAVVRLGTAPDPWFLTVADVLVGACIGAMLLLASGAYRVSELGAWRTHVDRLSPAIVGLVAYGTLIALLEPDGPVLAVMPITGAMAILALRFVAHTWWIGAAHGYGLARPVVVAGDPALLEPVMARLAATGGPGAQRPMVRIVTRIALADRACPDAFAADLAQVLEPIRAGAAETVLLALPWQDEAAVQQAVACLGNYAVDVFLVGGLIGLRDRKPQPGWLGAMPCLQLAARPLSGWGSLVKAVADRALAGVAVTLLSPMLLLIWLAIRLDSQGPALYRQKRQGRNGRMFDILKFRTMYIDRCDNGLGAVPQATRRDPRVTRVGRVLRRTSMDELPQLINVLKGEMSLVGPRPHAVAHDEHYGRLIERYAARRRMKPGITGWAQVNGYRGETDTLEKMRRRIEHDLDYIENWSLGLDLKILLRTLAVGFVHPNAR
jgi:Undecaprenyl-phosphate glucose phosphotransferase